MSRCFGILPNRFWKLCAVPSLGFLILGSPTQVEAQDSSQKKTFVEVLGAHKRYPKSFYKKADNMNPKAFDGVDPSKLDLLSNNVLEARYKLFNGSYRRALKTELKLKQELEELQKRLEQTPLSDFKKRSELELKNEALKGQYEQARFLVFITSINANESFQKALATVSPKAKMAARTQARVAERPKLPGVWGGAYEDRQKMNDSEKINLTPVDPEFYQSQLGQKLEGDLKGRAEYWSYDYNADDLYVVVNNEIAKLSVFEDAGGVRFIRTRVGDNFKDLISADTKIDTLKASGRFLTGNKKEETLFGKMPEKNKYLKEIPAGHSHDDGHDH